MKFLTILQNIVRFGLSHHIHLYLGKHDPFNKLKNLNIFLIDFFSIYCSFNVVFRFGSWSEIKLQYFIKKMEKL
jgi:hypothetical protein